MDVICNFEVFNRIEEAKPFKKLGPHWAKEMFIHKYETVLGKDTKGRYKQVLL